MGRLAFHTMGQIGLRIDPGLAGNENLFLTFGLEADDVAMPAGHRALAQKPEIIIVG